MGTRNLTKVIDKDGIVRVAQYGQWDGYPSGQGINALVHAYNYRQIESGLAKVRWANDYELEQASKKFRNADGNVDWEAYKLNYPNLVRDTCADILGVVAWSVGEVILVDESEFEKDELFCEGVYTIDFQKGKFISWYNGKAVEFDLTNLPYQHEYIKAWE